MAKKGFNFWFNIFILVGMMAAVTIANVGELKKEDAQVVKLIVVTIGAIMGVVNNVLSANGNIWTFFFGILDVLICSYTHWDSGDIGVVLQHMLYFLPMQFVGLWQWRKRGATAKRAEDGESHRVKARRFKAKHWVYSIVAFAVCTVAVYFVLYWIDLRQLEAGRVAQIDNSKLWLNACVFSLNCIGQLLLSLAFAEQWYIWNFVNVCYILLWTNNLMSPDAQGYEVVMLIKYSFYLLNSINGLRIWLHLSKNNSNECVVSKHGCC